MCAKILILSILCSSVLLASDHDHPLNYCEKALNFISSIAGMNPLDKDCDLTDYPKSSPTGLTKEEKIVIIQARVGNELF